MKKGSWNSCYFWVGVSTIIVACLFVGKAITGIMNGGLKPYDWIACGVWTLLLGCDLVLFIGITKRRHEEKLIYDEFEKMREQVVDNISDYIIKDCMENDNYEEMRKGFNELPYLDKLPKYIINDCEEDDNDEKTETD